jgi:putative SOS response-associated peptidase YedK
MCNYLGYRLDHEHVIWLKGIEKEFGESFVVELLRSGFVYGDWPVLRKREQSFEVVNMHWEFIPWWIKNGEELLAARKQGIPWLNATCEKLLESKMFRDAALKRRCLVPATHFFEWRHFKPEGAKKEVTYPYCIHLEGWKTFYMAGIWQPWVDRSTGETINTFAIVTTRANSIMENVHCTKKRMPTILPEELAYEWIMGDLTEQQIREIASFQIDSALMEAFTLKKDFRTEQYPLEPFQYAELPQIM